LNVVILVIPALADDRPSVVSPRRMHHAARLACRIVVSGSFLLVGRSARDPLCTVYAVPPDTLNNTSQKRCHTHINLQVITVHHGQVTGPPVTCSWPHHERVSTGVDIAREKYGVSTHVV
jgi:hypothetical protein